MKDKGALITMLIVVFLGATLAAVFGVPLLGKIFKKPAPPANPV